jgi:DNA-binding protein H-NS
MSAIPVKSHQNAPQAQIGAEAMADAVQLVKTLETPYLRDLRRLIDNEISLRSNEERREAIFKVQRIAADMGVTVAELMQSAMPKERKTGGNLGKKHGPAPAKYRNPEDHTQTWSGRGNAPKWVTAYESSGKSIADLLITKA